jgi:hypothetical protein
MGFLRLGFACGLIGDFGFHGDYDSQRLAKTTDSAE